MVFAANFKIVLLFFYVHQNYFTVPFGIILTSKIVPLLQRSAMIFYYLKLL